MSKNLFLFLIVSFVSLSMSGQSQIQSYGIYQFNGVKITGVRAHDSGALYFTIQDPILPGNIIEYIKLSKISASGHLEWTVNLDTINEDMEVPRDRIVLDPSGNILVTLYGVNHITQTGEAKLFKVSPLGQLIWEKRVFYHQASGNRFLEHLSVDSLGEIYLTSMRDYGGVPYYDVRHAIKLDSFGNQLWDYIVFPNGSRTVLGKMHLDRWGNTYNTYVSSVYTPGNQYVPEYSVISRVDRNGNELWRILDTNIRLYSSALGQDGHLYVSTFDIGQIPSLRCLDTSGVVLWVRNLASIQIIDEILIDAHGNSYTIGRGGAGLEISKRDSAGNIVWTQLYVSSTPGSEQLIEAHLIGDDIFMVILQDVPNQGPGLDQIIVARMDVSGILIDDLVIPTGTTMAGTSTFLEVAPNGEAWLTIGYYQLKSLLIKLCLFECGFNVSGEAFFDVDGDCNRDSSESCIPYHPISIDNGSMFTLTDGHGSYGIRRDTGNLVFDLVRPSTVSNSCYNGPYTIALQPGVIYDSLDFGLSAPPGADLSVSIIADHARAARHQNIRVHCLNHGSFPDSAMLELLIDSSTTIIPSTTMRDSIVGQHWYFDLGVLMPNIPKIVDLTVLIDTTVVIGDSCTHLAILQGASVDYHPANNLDSVTQPFRNSYDPNDKMVHPTGTGPEGEIDFQTIDDLSYTIRFQNTGNDIAYHVTVRDTLSPLLDLSTFQMGVASHNFRMELQDNRVLVWSFDNINLPDSTTDLAGSNGYLKFRIKPQPGLPLGTQLGNKAAIYFDFNPPIITNSALLTYALPLVASGVPTLTSALELFPNPTRGRVTLRLRDARQPQLHVQVCDLRGAVLRDESLRLLDDEASLDISALAPGIYLVQASQGATRHVQRLLVW